MKILIWMMVGILLLTITVFVHKHTYNYVTEKKLSFPVWYLLIMIVVALFPIANLGIFIIGGLVYIVNLGERDIEFKCESKWWKSIVAFLDKEI